MGEADENMLVKGDNLAVMRALLPTFAGRFRVAYLDPPFNTGRTFAEYKDSRPREAWLDMMRVRLAMVRELLSGDGALFVEIDDTELGPLQVLVDELFGAHSRVSTVTLVRSAATGHKAGNRGPVNVTDFLLVYARDRRRFAPTPVLRPRAGLDPAYRTFLENPGEPPETWRFSPLARAVARALGFGGAVEARRGLGDDALLRETTSFCLARPRQIVRFAQPRFEAISRAAQALVLASREEPSRVLCLERPGRPPLFLRGGNRILFLASKVRELSGKATLVEPLTNVWDDLPFQGIAKEGEVTFSRNKKPERLLERILTMASEPGDWVLDPFLGSGTAAAVAHTMGRRWVGIEAGEHFDTLCVPRLRRVVAGEDRTGIRRTQGFEGGGGFGVYR